MGYAVPPLAGLDKEKEKIHPYTTKGGAPAKATSKARQIDPQRQLANQEGSFAALRMAAKGGRQEKDPPLKSKGGAPGKAHQEPLLLRGFGGKH